MATQFKRSPGYRNTGDVLRDWLGMKSPDRYSFEQSPASMLASGVVVAVNWKPAGQVANRDLRRPEAERPTNLLAVRLEEMSARPRSARDGNLNRANARREPVLSARRINWIWLVLAVIYCVIAAIVAFS